MPETARVVPCVSDKYAIVTLDRARYSVPSDLARRAMVAKLRWDKVEAFDGAELVALHARSYVEGAHVLDALHILRILERKHRAIPESTAIAQLNLSPVFHALRVALRGKVRKPDREWVRVLLLSEEHSMEEFESAASAALSKQSPNLETIRMLLRQARGETLAVAPVMIESDALASIVIAEPVLAGYDELEGAAR
jgi:hypothetical protein